MLEKIILALRINEGELDDEVQSLIDACYLDLEISGINKSKIIEDDPLIVQACKCYCRSYFTTNKDEADRFKIAYNLIVQHLAVCKEYKNDN